MSTANKSTASMRRNLANAIRALSMDAVQRAKSGHPGAPMGMADIAEVLWNDFLRHNPANPQWPDRDRFILSNGHGCMLLYSLLHLSGYDLPLDEIKNFRQLHSKTPGHPEYGETPGVETTTGPLGQGIANAVGMALAERLLAAEFNRPGHDIVDHYTYVFLGDGCLMEGISHEVCSFAGTHGLGKLIAFYDDNGISIDGKVQGWFTDDTAKRFESYGWHVVPAIDGHNAEQIRRAIETARAQKDKPTLIVCRTVIAYGAPNLAGTSDAHGAPLGDAEIAAAREELNWPHEPFVIPDEIRSSWDARTHGAELEQGWHERMQAYTKAHPDLAAELERRLNGKLPAQWSEKADAYLAQTVEKAETVATRKASGNALDALAPALPELLGGSADLTGSNNTRWKGCHDIGSTGTGNYVYYGVREFGMSAMMNGITLHGGFIPYSGTFLTFSDYARNAVRLAALMRVRSIFVYTHDSIGLGEDGPTHQSVEHVASLRLMPNLVLWRPCDTTETAVAWQSAIEHTEGPTCFALTRQNVPHQMRDETAVRNIMRGGYVLKEAVGKRLDVILIATGSEVDLAVQAHNILSERGIAVRVVSMPCTQVFDAQDPTYRESVLPAEVTARIAIEAGVTDYWRKYVGLQGAVIGLDRYGLSAPAKDLFAYFGFTPERIVEQVEQLLA